MELRWHVSDVWCAWLSVKPVAILVVLDQLLLGLVFPSKLRLRPRKVSHEDSGEGRLNWNVLVVIHCHSTQGSLTFSVFEARFILQEMPTLDEGIVADFEQST